MATGELMLEQFLHLFHNLPREIIIILVATLPLFELRLAIPLGIAWHLHWQKIFFLSILGNLLPIPFILILLAPVSERLRQFRLWRSFFHWLFAETRKKAKTVERWEFWGLILLVGIPLPMTGAWTGAVAASLFKLGFFKGMLSITLGVVIAAVVVTSLVLTGRLVISWPAKF